MTTTIQKQGNNANNKNTLVTFSDLMTQLEDKSLPDACAEYVDDIYGRIILWLGIS